MSTTCAKAITHSWLAEPLSPDVADAVKRLAFTEDVQRIAIMPDVHIANEVCVGTVVGTKNYLFPAAIGSDIGCGIVAIRFAATAHILADETAAARVLENFYQHIPRIRHSSTTMPRKLPDILQTPLSCLSLEKLKQRDGLVQFATLGRGNHFLELQKDQENMLWLMIHSGSRAMGKAITEHHLAKTQTTSTGLQYLNANEPNGRAYLADLEWATRYAEYNRLAMMETASGLFGELFAIAVDHTSLIHGQHNHVRKENHFDEELWVHRKGALSASDGETGVIAGSMGTASFHVIGKGHSNSLKSSSHGAGRTLSRYEAKRLVSTRQFYKQMQDIWFDHRYANDFIEECPTAYKDIHKVMRAQRELTKITRKLQPLLSFKGK